MHYQRQRNGLPLDLEAVVKPDCSVDGCTKPSKARGLCGTHYHHYWQAQKPEREYVHKKKTETHSGWIDWSGTTGIYVCNLCEHTTFPAFSIEATREAGRDHHYSEHASYALDIDNREVCCADLYCDKRGGVLYCQRHYQYYVVKAHVRTEADWERTAIGRNWYPLQRPRNVKAA